MDKQNVFDKVVRGLAGQGWKPSVRGTTVRGTTCRYRADDGAKCAIGHLIPDEKYTSALENTSVFNDKTVAALSDTLGYGTVGEERYDDANLRFLARLQNVHDDAVSHGERAPSVMRRNLKELGEFEGLAWPSDVE